MTGIYPWCVAYPFNKQRFFLDREPGSVSIALTSPKQKETANMRRLFLNLAWHYGQLGNLNDPMRVCQFVPVASRYSVVNQNVQSSFGSTDIEE